MPCTYFFHSKTLDNLMISLAKLLFIPGTQISNFCNEKIDVDMSTKLNMNLSFWSCLTDTSTRIISFFRNFILHANNHAKLLKLLSWFTLFILELFSKTILKYLHLLSDGLQVTCFTLCTC